jgi:hypothetical protein
MNEKLIKAWINAKTRNFKIQTIDISKPIGRDFRVNVYEKIGTGIVSGTQITESYFIRIVDNVVTDITKTG